MLFHVLSKINGWNFSDFFAWSYSVIKRLKSLPLVFAGNNAFPHGEEGQNRIPRKGLQSKKKFSWRISEYARKKKNVLLETKFKIWICIYKIKQNLTINQCTKQLLQAFLKIFVLPKNMAAVLYNFQWSCIKIGCLRGYHPRSFPKSLIRLSNSESRSPSPEIWTQTTPGYLLLIFVINNCLPAHMTQIDRASDVQKTSRMSYERIMYVLFTSCVQESGHFN